jgi:hypothetical protein
MTQQYLFDTFRAAYLEAIFFTEFHSDNPELENLGYEDFSPELIKSIDDDCKAFISESGLVPSDPITQAGHDFWLTRNGHGAGFWDREDLYTGCAHNGAGMTEIAKRFGENNIYLGDDGLVY